MSGTSDAEFSSDSGSLEALGSNQYNVSRLCFSSIAKFCIRTKRKLAEKKRAGKETNESDNCWRQFVGQNFCVISKP